MSRRPACEPPVLVRTRAGVAEITIGTGKRRNALRSAH